MATEAQEKDLYQMTFEELEIYAASLGIDSSHPKYLEQLQKRHAVIEGEELQKRENSRVRPESYKRVKTNLLVGLEYTSFVIAFIITTIFVGGGMVLLYVAETASVQLGIMTFFHETIWIGLNQSWGIGFDVDVATLLAFTLVTYYFVIEWRVASLEKAYGIPKQRKISLRLILSEVTYFFNVFQPPVEHADDQELLNSRRTRSIVIAIMLVLGTLARLYTLISSYDQQWYIAVVLILVESTLVQFLEYFGGAFISFAMFQINSFAVSYVYNTFYSAVGGEMNTYYDPMEATRRKTEVNAKLLRATIQNQLTKLDKAKQETNSVASAASIAADLQLNVTPVVAHVSASAAPTGALWTATMLPVETNTAVSLPVLASADSGAQPLRAAELVQSKDSSTVAENRGVVAQSTATGFTVKQSIAENAPPLYDSAVNTSSNYARLPLAPMPDGIMIDKYRPATARILNWFLAGNSDASSGDPEYFTDDTWYIRRILDRDDTLTISRVHSAISASIGDDVPAYATVNKVITGILTNKYDAYLYSEILQGGISITNVFPETDLAQVNGYVTLKSFERMIAS